MDAFQPLLKFETFVEFFRREKDGDNLSGMILLLRFIEMIDRTQPKVIRSIVHTLTGKWPHVKDDNELKQGTKRIIQSRYYQELYHRPIPDNVRTADQEMIERLLLRDVPYVAPQPEHLKKYKPPKPKPKADRPPRPKHVKPKTRFSLKVAKMSLEQVIDWANEVGVLSDKIDQHKAKPLGLAKMSIANLIKGELRRQKKLGDLIEMIIPDEDQ